MTNQFYQQLAELRFAKVLARDNMISQCRSLRKGKIMDEKLTAYCGLCCADCIPSREELFVLVDRLDQALEQLQFDKYADSNLNNTRNSKTIPLSFQSCIRSRSFAVLLHAVQAAESPIAKLESVSRARS